MEVLNDLLGQNLKIYQNSDWFSFSLDSVLLANFVKTKSKMKIMDFCTGNAPIPLFLSTKTKSKIIGVELQREVYDLAVKSVNINELSNQIEIVNMHVKDISKIYDTDTFDLITCNPPYFKMLEKSNINDNIIKAKARHEISLSLNDVFLCAKKILKNNGKIAIVHRTDRLVEIINKMRENNIEPKRIKFIFPNKNSASNLVLIEGAKNGNSGLTVEKGLIVHEENGNYTKEVLNIFNGE